MNRTNQRDLTNQTVKGIELLVVILERENTFNESLILAQDERWRRA